MSLAKMHREQPPGTKRIRDLRTSLSQKFYYTAGRLKKDKHMPFEIIYHEKEDFVESRFTGPITRTLTRDYVEALLPVLESTGCKRVLNDSINAKLQLSSIDIMQLPKMAAGSPLTAGLERRAAVAAEGSSGYEMYETLSKIQGQHLRMFTDREQAIEWLLSDRN